MAEAKAMFKSVTGSLQAYAGALMAMLGQNPGIVVEPFARSASVAMNYGNDTRVIINDKFKPIAAIYKACADDAIYEHLVERFSKADKSKETRDQYLQDLKGVMCINLDTIAREELEELAYKSMYILSSGWNHGWHGFSNLLGTSQWRAEVLAGLQNANDLMRHGEVKSDDGVKIVHEYSQVEGAAFLIDPPFLYRDKGVKAKDYELEFASLWDHARLLNVLRGAKARVILVGYRPKDSRVTCLYDILSDWEGSKWHCYKLSDKKNKAQRLKYGEKHKNCELYVWCNFELPEVCKYYMSSRDYLEPLSYQQYALKMIDAIEAGLVQDADVADFKRMVTTIENKRAGQDVKAREWNLDVNVYEKITEV